MLRRGIGKLTASEATLVDTVRSEFVRRFPGGDAGSLRWRNKAKVHKRRLLFVHSRDQGPVFFIKSSVNRKASFRKEYEVLRRLGENSALAATVPEVVTYLEDDGFSAIVETVVRGRQFPPVRLWQPWRRQAVQSHMASVLSWWKSLVDSSPAVDRDGLVATHIQEVKKAFIDSHARANESIDLPQLMMRLDRCGASRLQLSLIHGDLWRENILCGDEGIVVLDWERAEDPGLPLLDMLLFLTTLIDDGTESGFERVFFSHNWLSALARPCLTEACGFLGLGRTEAEDLFYFFLVMMSSQTMRLLGVPADWDDSWYARLRLAMRNQQSVSRLFDQLPQHAELRP